MKYFYYNGETGKSINDAEIISLTKSLDDFYTLSEEEGSFLGIQDDEENIIQFMYDDVWIIDIPIKGTRSTLSKEDDFNECTNIINSFYK